MSKEELVVDRFIDSLNVFIDAYRGNTGTNPFGIALGPEAFVLLCIFVGREAPAGLGDGGAAPGERKSRTMPVVTQYREIPITVKFTPGAEIMIDPLKAASVHHARMEKHAGHLEEASQIKLQGV